ncbi:MAG: hypothetical protein GTO41_27555 [Burkholderiales bacterium]|nr:hypothetical protein [Burkholderiales bacterium]
MSWLGKDTIAANKIDAITNLVAEIAACADEIDVVAHGGLILRSPDGSRWRVKVDNAGALSTEKII